MNQLKQILTIKNTISLSYIQKILTYNPDCKPLDRLTHGYSEPKVQGKKSFYQRDRYRYKKKKEEKMKMEKVLM